jgi:outer membrane receptor protein involved in Fe transport
MNSCVRVRARAAGRATRVVIGLAFGLASSCAASRAVAQEAGVVEGVAQDASRHPISDAAVTLETPDGHVVGHSTTGSDGTYRFSGVMPGSYLVVGAKQGIGTATANATVGDQKGASVDLTLLSSAQEPTAEVTVTAQRLNAARENIEPSLGASNYTLSSQSIANLPQGQNTPLNDVLLQAPGVAQDNLANGAIHVRNEHLNVQYRINGVTLPDGLSFFGQGLSPRFVDSMSLLTGALPAQYGLRTAGIVDIQTKSGVFQNGGSVDLYGGSYATMRPSIDYAGSAGGYNYFFAGSGLHSDHGTNAPTAGYNALHDATWQEHAFGYLEKIIDPSSKLSFFAGTFTGTFQIPNNPGQAPGFGPLDSSNPTPDGSINGVTNFNSSALNEHQDEGSYFAAASYLRSEEDFDFQVSNVLKYSTLHFYPDATGDIAFNGIAQNALRQDVTNTLQGEGTYRLGGGHTLRGGLIFSGERASSDTNSLVLPTDPITGSPTSSTPQSITDDAAKTGWTYSAYLQDEWKVLSDVTINYGARFDVVNSVTMENQISPRLNVVWQATSATTVHAGYANYFTPPPFELAPPDSVNVFANTTGATASSGNSPLKAERAHVFDVGVTQDVLPGLKVGLDAYYKYARNLLDEGQFGAPVVLTPFNYHVGYTKGVELTTTYDKGPFSYYGNLAFGTEKAEGVSSAQFNFSQDDLDYIAAHQINTDHSQVMTASAGMSYLWHDTRFSVDVIAGTGLRTQEDNNPIPNGSTVPSYEQVNFGVSHRFADAPGGPITIRADLINVFDEAYLIRSQSGVGVFSSQYGPRRTFYVGVRKEF